jgi:hypothetical protein
MNNERVLPQLVGLTLVLLLLSACDPRQPAPMLTPVKTAQSTDETLFVDVTDTHLPTSNLQGFSMDAKPVDVDGDGDLDIVAANLDDLSGRRSHAPYRVYVNNGTGVFQEATQAVFPSGVTGNGSDIEAADFNGDGCIDLYLSSRGGPDRLLFKKATYKLN